MMKTTILKTRQKFLCNSIKVSLIMVEAKPMIRSDTPTAPPLPAALNLSSNMAWLHMFSDITLPKVDLAGAVERLSGGMDTYEYLYPQLRKDAVSSLSVAASLISDGLRAEAKLMFRGLVSLAQIIGAPEVVEAATQAQKFMDLPASDKDHRTVLALSASLLGSYYQLDCELMSGGERFGGKKNWNHGEARLLAV